MKLTSRRSITTSSPPWCSRSTASRTRSTVARSISPLGATIRAPPRRCVATSKLPGAATSPRSSSHLSHESAGVSGSQELLSHGGGLLALQVYGGVHAPHRIGGQLAADRIQRSGQLRPVLPCEVAPDHRRQVLEREQVARILEDLVAPARQLAFGGEDREDVDLPFVERRIARRKLQRNELEVLDLVDGVEALRALEARLELGQGTELEVRDAL